MSCFKKAVEEQALKVCQPPYNMAVVLKLFLQPLKGQLFSKK